MDFFVKAHDNLVNSVAFSPDGTTIASDSTDRTVKLWQAANGIPVREFHD